MYKNFFGFKERPFKLVPNPAYLFLSGSHEEALAHLTYALSQGDGFVEMTGEVGTGKTTLCRSFLEGLDEKTEAAYIFNPKLDSIQLLKAINDEFSINSCPDNTKDLIDILNAFLIEKRGQGKRVILLIDEAQNLTKEVLEQLRLLSNLETSKDKLLQMILVGQPELGEMLDSRELRQLGQRITLHCHITPLTYKETRGYIKHRISIASQGQGVKFSRSAFRAIYRYSGGVPRLINIVSDRALLTAFGLNSCKITGSIARASIRELESKGHLKGLGFLVWKKAVAVLSVLFAAFLMVFLYRSGALNIDTLFIMSKNANIESPGYEEPHLKTDPPPEAYQTGIKQQEEEKSEPSESSFMKLGDFLMTLDGGASRYHAMKGVMELWNSDAEIELYLESIRDDGDFFRLAAKQNGLLIHRMKGGLSLVKQLNLPAILEFSLPESLSSGYLVLCKMEENRLVLRGGEEGTLIEASPYEIQAYWSGMAYIPWKDFFGYSGDILSRSSKDTIITLKIHLRDIGFETIEMSPFYDEETRRVIEDIQEKHGIPVDGIVGPLTKIVLYNEKSSLKIPHISSLF